MPVVNRINLMEDELLYSYISRIADENGMNVDGFSSLYVDNMAPGKDPEDGFLQLPIGSSIYIPKIAAICHEDPLDFFFKTTIYPGTAPLLTPARQIGIINTAFRNVYRYPHLIGSYHSDVRDLKYCPVCRQNDLNKLGYSWLRRRHHMPGVSACCDHGVMLENVIRKVRADGTELIYPVTETKMADDIEVCYARFARDFLNAGLDLNSATSILHFIRADKLRQIGKISNVLDQVQKEKFLDEKRRKDKSFQEAKLLVWLFTVYEEVENISCDRDIYFYNRFMSALDGYELLSDYNSTGLRMRKIGEADAFVTTVHGFLLGWRSPSEDICCEEEKFSIMAQNLQKMKQKQDPVPAYKADSDKPRRYIEANLNNLCYQIGKAQLLRGKTKEIVDSANDIKQTSFFDFLNSFSK